MRAMRYGERERPAYFARYCLPKLRSLTLTVLHHMLIERKTLWRVLAIAPMLIAWLAVYHDVLWRLVDDWRVDENYSHGFLIPVISGYAIWAKREKLLALRAEPRWIVGGALMLLSALMLFAGVMGAELYITRLSLVLSLTGLTVYFGGFAWLRQLLFPIGLLLFALPVPNIVFNQIAFPLQLIASDYATRAIKLFGIPALREGNVIELAQMKLQVVEACSGIRSLVTLAALAVVYAYFAETRWWRRIILVVAVIPIAVIANAARVSVTGVLAHHQGVKAAEGFMHSFSGLAVFLVAVALLLLLAQALNLIERFLAGKKDFSPTKTHEEHTKDSVSSPTVKEGLENELNQINHGEHRDHGGRQNRIESNSPCSPWFDKALYLMMLLFLTLMASSVSYLARTGEREHTPQRTEFAAFPVEMDSWRQVEIQTLDDKTNRELAADDYLSRTYSNGQAYAYLFIAFHNSQRHRQTFHSPQNCMPGAGWTMGNYSLLRFESAKEKSGGVVEYWSGDANVYLIEKDGSRMLALYWYQGRGKMIAGEYRARFDTIKDAMWLGRTDGALVRVIVPMGKDEAAEELARKAAMDFAGKLLPILPSYIPN